MRFAFSFLFLTIFCNIAPAQEWARFRGPNGSGFGTAEVPDSWTVKDFLWKTKIPGRGHSSPILWGDKIFVTSAESGGKRFALAVDAKEGKILWQREMDGASYKMHKRNSVATSTPVADSERVYFAWATPEKITIHAMDHLGNKVWEANLGPFASQHGFGVSPILFNDLVILPNDQDGKGSLLALDAKTGNKRWEIPRKSGNATYSTPCIYEPKGKSPQVIFTNWQHGITGVDPIQGKVIWEISVFETQKQERSIVSPFVAGDLILGTCGFTTAQKHLVAVRPDGEGKAKEVWRFEKSVSHMPTPIVKDPWIFVITEKGLATCLDIQSGKVLWEERLDNNFSASPILIGDRIFCTGDDGEVIVLKAGQKYEKLGQGQLGESTQSTPAAARGKLIFRTNSYLLAIGSNG